MDENGIIVKKVFEPLLQEEIKKMSSKVKKPVSSIETILFKKNNNNESIEKSKNINDIIKEMRSTKSKIDFKLNNKLLDESLKSISEILQNNFDYEELNLGTITLNNNGTTTLMRSTSALIEDIFSHKNRKRLTYEWRKTLSGDIKLNFKNGITNPLTHQAGTYKTNNISLSLDARDSLETKRTTQVTELLAAGADFLKNFFEVEFAFRDKETQRFDKLLYTRIGSIEIPRLKAKTFSVKTIRGTIEKMASKMEGSYETSLTIRLDQDCFLLDKFSEIGGIWEFDGTKTFAASSLFVNDTNISFKQHKLDILVKDISGLEHIDSKNTYNQFKSIYMSRGLSNSQKVLANTPNAYLNENSSAGIISEWVLEDAKIVSISDINYSFGTTSPPEVTMQIICRNVSHHIWSSLD